MSAAWPSAQCITAACMMMQGCAGAALQERRIGASSQMCIGACQCKRAFLQITTTAAALLGRRGSQAAPADEELMQPEAQQQAASGGGGGGGSGGPAVAVAAAADGSGSSDASDGKSPARTADVSQGVSIKLEEDVEGAGKQAHQPTPVQDDWEAFMNWDKDGGGGGGGDSSSTAAAAGSNQSGPAPHPGGLGGQCASPPAADLPAGSQGSGDTPFGAESGECRPKASDARPARRAFSGWLSGNCVCCRMILASSQKLSCRRPPKARSRVMIVACLKIVVGFMVYPRLLTDVRQMVDLPPTD